MIGRSVPSDAHSCAVSVAPPYKVTRHDSDTFVTRKLNMGCGATIMAMLLVVVSAVSAVATTDAASKFPPGDVVVSINAYAEPIERNAGTLDTDGVPDNEAPPAVPETETVVVPDGVPERVGESDAVFDSEAPPEVVPDFEPVIVPDGVRELVGDTDAVGVSDGDVPDVADGVTDGEVDRVAVCEVVRDFVVVPDVDLDVVGDRDEVTVTDAVDDKDDPPDDVPVPDRVGDGVGWTMPVTRKPHREADPGLKELVHETPVFVVLNTPTNESKLWSGGATVSPK